MLQCAAALQEHPTSKLYGPPQAGVVVAAAESASEFFAQTQQLNFWVQKYLRWGGTGAWRETQRAAHVMTGCC